MSRISQTCSQEETMNTVALSEHSHSLTESSSTVVKPVDSSAFVKSIVLLGRVLFALIFLMTGFRHFSSQVIAYAASQGIPLASIAVPAIGLVAFFGGLSILLGYRARLGTWLIVLFLIAVTPMHKFWGISDPMMQQMQMAQFMKNLSMLGGALLISQLGAGPWSLDSKSLHNESFEGNSRDNRGNESR
jgi:putative oxidoreductase